MRLNDLFEDVRSDKENVREAHTTWNIFEDKMTQQLRSFELYPFDAFERTFGELFSAIIKSPYRIDLSETEYLWVRFTPGNPQSNPAAFITQHRDGKVLTKNTIVLNYDDSQLSDDNEMISIRDFMGEMERWYKSAFVHEFTHYTDARRAKDDNSYRQRKIKQTRTGEYINTDHEFNAFYSQLVDSVLNMEKNGILAKEMPNVKTFKDFLDMIVMNTGEEYTRLRDELKGKYQRSLKKRLYNLYQDLLKDFS